MATDAQISANRRNAQKSTGPRTRAGKAKVSRNALKHTALARNLLASDPAPRKNPAEFKALCQDYYAELKPRGPFEKMLVDEVITAVWRKRRARQAHSAEMALKLKTIAQNATEGSIGSGHVERVLKFAAINPGVDIIDLLAANQEGCNFVLRILREAHRIFQSDDPASEKMLAHLLKPFGSSAESITRPLARILQELKANAQNLGPIEGSRKYQRDVLAFFEGKIRYYEQLMPGRPPQSNGQAQACLDAALLPASHILNKILCYEAKQDRQISLAMDQLRKFRSRQTVAATPTRVMLYQADC